MANLSSSSAVASGTYNLTSIGTADWQSAGVGPAAGNQARKNVTQLLTVTRTGGTADSYFDPGVGSVITWTDGTPNATGTTSTAKHCGLNANGYGYTISVPAGTGPRQLKLLVGVYNGTLRATPTLSDGSATGPSISWTATGAVDQRVITIDFSAATDGQTLTVPVVMESVQGGGAVHFLAATLTTAGTAATVPGAPTIGTVTAGNSSASVAGTAPASDGGAAITGYMATSTPGGITGTSPTMPVNVAGLTNGTAYTFKLKAQNSVGYGPESAASNSVTPAGVNNAPTFPGGSIPNITGSAGTAITPINVSSYFSDTDTLTYSASPSGTAWPTGLSINSATGVISGTVAAASTTTGIRVRATDTASQSVDSNAFNVTVTADASQVSISDAKVVWSPYTWDDRSTYKSSNNPGAYVKLAFTGTSVAVKVDVSHLVAAGVSASSYPTISMVVDGYSVVDTKLTSGMTAITRAGLSSGAHTVEISFNATDASVSRWGTDPTNAVRITGFTIDSAGTLTQATALPNPDLIYGDSIIEGWAALNTGAPAGNSARHTISPILAKALNAEYGVIGFSGIGYQDAGFDVPKILNSFGLYSSGRSRLINGLFVPQPRNIFCELGANGTTFQSDVQAVITAFRAAAPNARIFMMVPAGGFARSAITAAVAANSSDAKVHLLDLGTEYQAGIDRGPGNQQTLYSVDGLHRNALANARVAGGFIKQIQMVLDGVVTPTLTARTVTLTLGDTVGAVANLTGIKVGVYDEPTPNLYTVPRYQNANMTTNASGVMAITYQSTLAAGGICGVGVQLADGRNFNVSGTVA